MPASECPFGRVLKVWPSACEISQMLVERARGHLGGVPKNARAPKPSMLPLLLTGTRQDVTRLGATKCHGMSQIKCKVCFSSVY